jgi:hypothetical protein
MEPYARIRHDRLNTSMLSGLTGKVASLGLPSLSQLIAIFNRVWHKIKRKEYNIQRYVRNKASIKTRSLTWRRSPKGQAWFREYKRNYYLKYPERKAAELKRFKERHPNYFNEWKRANRKHLNEYHRLYSKLNRDKLNAIQQRYRERKKRGLIVKTIC